MISIVVPIHNEKPILAQLFNEVEIAASSTGLAWELLIVDDGSTDGSLSIAMERQRRDPRIRIVELSRNWGHQQALSAGLHYAKGAAVVLMDGDLQDPPSVIPALTAAWRTGAQVVVAQRRSRNDLWLQRALYRAFYATFAMVSDFPIPLGAGIFGLLDRQAVDALNSLNESNRYLPGLRSWIGYPTSFVFYDRGPRAAGKPKQTLRKLARYAFDAIFSFSYKPLRFSLVMGLATALFALVFGVILITARVMGTGIFGGPVVIGYTSTIVSILLLGGVQLIAIGILGEYLGRIFDEVKKRPLYLVRKVHE